MADSLYHLAVPSRTWYLKFHRRLPRYFFRERRFSTALVLLSENTRENVLMRKACPLHHLRTSDFALRLKQKSALDYY